MSTATDPHRSQYGVPIGTARTPARPDQLVEVELPGDVPVHHRAAPISEETARSIAASLESIAASLAKMVAPPAVSPADQVRDALRAIKEEMPILGCVWDQMTAQAAAKGMRDVS